MTTLTRPPTNLHVELDPRDVPTFDAHLDATRPDGSLRVSVQRIEPPRSDERLAWGTCEGRTILFRIDEATCRELTARVEEGEDATSTVDPDQIVAADLDGLA